MWDKPRELTKYKGDDFEIVLWYSINTNDYEAFNGWKNSDGHNDAILKQGIWKIKTWNAIGIGIYKNFAVGWFGEEIDN